MESLKDQLYKSFNSYIEYATPYLRSRVSEKKKRDEKIRIAHIDSSFWLPPIIEKIESSKKFDTLVSHFAIAFGRDPKKPNKGQYLIRNFFRRSKLYLVISEAKPENFDDFFEKLCSAFDNRRVKITSLHLIEEVDFHDNFIDFRTFKIQRFSKAQLDELIDNKINHIFYPYAELDTTKLCHYWFILEEIYEEKQKEHLFEIELDESWEDFSRSPRTFPNRVLQILSLFDWDFDWERKGVIKTDDIESGWLGFSIPVSLCIIDDIFENPLKSPNPSFPYYDSRIGENGEGREFYIHLDKDDLEKLKNIVDKAQNFLENINLKECKWQFLDIALGYLAKAFFTEGLDQLLWHMTVLEALFGQKDEVIGSLKRRVSNILGKTNDEKETIQKEIVKLYGFRSDLVHGNTFKREVLKGHLRKARNFTRESLIWFLSFLSIIHMEMRKKGIPVKNYPHRKELLILLDSEKFDSERMRLLLENSPADFPQERVFGDGESSGSGIEGKKR